MELDQYSTEVIVKFLRERLAKERNPTQDPSMLYNPTATVIERSVQQANSALDQLLAANHAIQNAKQTEQRLTRLQGEINGGTDCSKNRKQYTQALLSRN